MISSFPASAVGGTCGPAVISSFSAEVTAPSPSPLRNVTSTPESTGESCGTVQVQRNACPFHTLHWLFPLESSWCHGLRTSAERNVTVRRVGANPRRSREFNVKRNANLWRNLKSVTMPERLLQGARRLEPTRNFLVLKRSATSSALLHGYENVFSAHNAVQSTLVDHLATEVSVRRIWRIPSVSETQT